MPKRESGVLSRSGNLERKANFDPHALIYSSSATGVVRCCSGGCEDCDRLPYSPIHTDDPLLTFESPNASKTGAWVSGHPFSEGSPSAPVEIHVGRNSRIQPRLRSQSLRTFRLRPPEGARVSSWQSWQPDDLFNMNALAFSGFLGRFSLFCALKPRFRTRRTHLSRGRASPAPSWPSASGCEPRQRTGSRT